MLFFPSFVELEIYLQFLFSNTNRLTNNTYFKKFVFTLSWVSLHWVSLVLVIVFISSRRFCLSCWQTILWGGKITVSNSNTKNENNWFSIQSKLTPRIWKIGQNKKMQFQHYFEKQIKKKKTFIFCKLNVSQN